MNVTTPDSTSDLYASFVLGNYGTPACTLTRGEGVYVWDSEGRRLLDFGAGIAVTSIGHCHPHWVKAVQEQAATLVHCSNLYRHPGQGRLAQRLCGYAGPGKVLLCNSGAEANEAMLKLARLHGRAKTGEEGKCFKVLTAEKAFHGRTFGAMAATPQEKIQGGFRPMLDGFAHGVFNDLASFEALVDDSVAAILVEAIQGESGVNPATVEFLQGLRALCDKHGLLLMMDEVQCGIGRTGRFFGFEEAGIVPDAFSMAKGLGGGIPIGAVWMRDAHAPLFKPGSHGTTYGGNPLVCAAANAVLDVIESEDLLAQVTAQSKGWIKRLQELERKFPALVEEVRGRGYMVGVALKVDPMPVIQTLREKGMLAIPTGGQVIRLLPPLTATVEDLDRSVELLADALSNHLQA
ncbi:aspartate aminotransferase family protein [Ruficoccus amylovorans]|uniref:Acetylornithine aminotransferase n=1 Tax=Ruficoccus amylovorans TaxID=1804625 RepID=A0A842HJ40_9BACT|nr:aspartate aminotransferase family protein [Ruficoccus amylovorans]MBC2596442.1 aspartate aminotransferase family protein [Ruficoccus amylovorans]